VRANGKGRSIPRQDSGPSTTIAILQPATDAVVDLAAYRASRDTAAEASRRPA
jgi:hypothetical protein